MERKVLLFSELVLPSEDLAENSLGLVTIIRFVYAGLNLNFSSKCIGFPMS